MPAGYPELGCVGNAYWLVIRAVVWSSDKVVRGDWVVGSYLRRYRVCLRGVAELADFPDTGVVGSRAGYHENFELQGRGKGVRRG